jgi:flagellin-like hook-associated protein FlgL
MPSRIGSEALFRSQLSYLQRIQNRQYLVDEQISTGFKSQTFAGVASDAGTIISSSAMMAKIDQYNRNITIATNRMKLMDTSLSAIDKSISTLNGYLAQLSDSTTPPDVPTLAKDLLNQVTDFLNLNDGERYLFAGSNVSTAPVKTLSAGGGVAPTVPAVPATLSRVNSAVAPLTNYDAATQTYYKPNPDDPTQLLAYKQNLPPLTTIELNRDATDDPIEAGRVVEGSNGARGRIMYHSTTGGVPENVRIYIEPLNEIPFTPNDSLVMKDLTQSGSTYVENTPANLPAPATRSYTMIGGIRNANIDTQSVQISGPLPNTLRPGVTVQIGPAVTDRYIIASIEPSTTVGVNPVLQLRPLPGNSALTPTVAARQIDVVTGPLATDVTFSTVNTGVNGGIELIGRAADYQTNATAVGSTGYYNNTQAAREILNPQKVQVTDNSTVDYGISADKAGFARLIYTLNFLQQQTSPLNKDDVAAASKILVEARTQITSLRASSGINQKTLIGITEQNTLQKSIANNNFDDLAKQDKTEAIATLTSLQTILEASYSSFARIQDLNLQSFLR